MVVSAVDVFCRLTKDLTDDNKEIPNVIANKAIKRRSKSVTFADSKGLALTSTFFFIKENLSPPVTRRTSIGTRLKDNKQRNDPEQPAQLLNFTSNISYEELFVKVNNTNVCLEKIVCYTFGIYGRICVKNMAYEKCVAVRYSFDAWQSCQEEIARYIPGASTDNVDSFFFHMQPPKTNTDRKMEFAIRYRVCGKDYWDNNFGDNYRLVYYKTNPVDTLNLPLLNDPPDRNI
jgi:protein phosphatase 1 regulatory subunit 3A/B/C/D/E